MSRFLIPELSVFFPAFNEEKNIENTVEKAISVLKEITPKWEVLIINDGSRDKTGEVSERLAKKYKNIRVIHHPVNRGYGSTFKDGFYNAKYEWITFNDGDGQFDFSDIKKLIAKQKETGNKIIIGYYLSRKVPLFRIWGSKVWELAVFLMFGLKVKDIDCAFKLVNKKVIETIPKLEAERGPFISSEFLIKAKKCGFKISEVGVTHLARQAGSATGTDLNVLAAAFTDLFRLWFKLNFSKK